MNDPLCPYGEVRRTSSLISAFATESHKIGFPTGGDSAIFGGKGTEVSLLSRKDNRTRMGREMGQSLFFCQNPGWDAGCGMRCGMGYGTGRRMERGMGHETGRGKGRATLFFPYIFLL